jgi:uncharacterized membrane protein
VWWLLERLPHGGLRLFGALLYAAVAVRLLLNWDNLLRYQERGLPIFNWLLYTYGAPALCCLLGARCLRRSDEAGRLRPWRWLAPGAAFLGLLLIFALLNLEIAHYFSSGSRWTSSAATPATWSPRRPGASTPSCCSRRVSGAASARYAWWRWASWC